jgi:phage repressor protein C with HTH and peptisase S24 domain
MNESYYKPYVFIYGARYYLVKVKKESGRFYLILSFDKDKGMELPYEKYKKTMAIIKRAPEDCLQFI